MNWKYEVLCGLGVCAIMELIGYIFIMVKTFINDTTTK